MPSYVLLVLLGTVACGTPAGTIADRVTCDTCRIDITPLLTIGDTAGPSILTGRPGYVWTNDKGKYWIGVLDAAPMLFDSPAGTLAEFAREGRGPGEFHRAEVVAYLPDDSLLVTDFRAWHVVNPVDMLTARTIALTEQLTQVRIYRWPDKVLGLSQPYLRQPGSEVIGRYVAALYDFSGSVVTADTVYATPWSDGGDPVDYASNFRLTADGFGEGDIWIANVNAYTGAGGRMVEMRVSALPANYELNRTIIEVIDVAQKRVIARHEFDGFISAVLPDNRVASFVETESGVPVLTIHQLTLH